MIGALLLLLLLLLLATFPVQHFRDDEEELHGRLANAVAARAPQVTADLPPTAAAEATAAATAATAAVARRGCQVAGHSDAREEPGVGVATLLRGSGSRAVEGPLLPLQPLPPFLPLLPLLLLLWLHRTNEHAARAKRRATLRRRRRR